MKLAAVVDGVRSNPLVTGAIAAGVVALLVVGRCNRAGDAERRAAAADERTAAAVAGVVVAQPIEDLRPKVAELERSNAELRGELERARRAVPGAKPVAVVSARTAPAPVTAAPRPADPPGADAPPCVLAQGDELELVVDQVVLEGKAGAHLVAGTVAAWRSSDGSMLLREPFSASVTVAVEKASPAKPAPRWGVGALGTLNGAGWSAGALLASPGASVPLVGWQVEAWGGAATGPGGTVALAGIVVRP